MNIIAKITFAKKLVVLTALLFLVQPMVPTVAWALTGGPTSPESTGFQPADNENMVDLFTGDFSYNIPLFELPGPNGGYPFNLGYSSGIGMEDEASWVGLGWSLNPGAINRNVRGLPDDFNGDHGDKIITEVDLRNNWTVGVKVHANFEVFGLDLEKSGISPSLGAGIYYNSYNGFGTNLSGGVNFSTSNTGSSNAGLGLSISMDSQEGVGLNPNISIGGKMDAADRAYNSMSIGVGLNSKSGLTDVSLKLGQTSGGKSYQKSTGKYTGARMLGSSGASASFSPGASAFSPSQDIEMGGSNVSITFKGGLEIFGADANASITGYYSEQHIKDKHFETAPYGYLNYEDASANGLVDFNREKDGMIRYEVPNLPIPSLTYDIYSISGQGTGGSFRPFRSHVGRIRDKHALSEFGGGGIGLDLGGGVAYKVGVDLSQNSSFTETGDWTGQSPAYDFASDLTASTKNGYEPFYFKIPGELTTEPVGYYDYMGGSDVVAVSGNQLYKKNGGTVSPGIQKRSGNSSSDVRKPRNKVVESYTNDEILKVSKNGDLLTDFSGSYYDGIAGSALGWKTKPTDDFWEIRNAGKAGYGIGHHMGGYSILEPSGLRYVYGLPVYNVSSRDEIFSTDGSNLARSDLYTITTSGGKYHDLENQTDQYWKKTETTPYTTAHLLTSLLGSDYIDVNANGPDDADLGYWVKFTYAKAYGDYKWRAPFEKANYIKGSNSIVSDDKASFMFGEKEVYYLAHAETRTHIAVFEMDYRDDAAGPNNALQNSGIDGDKLYRLVAIKLYEKEAYLNQTSPTPIQTVHFEYDYSLCSDIPNSHSTTGKLTLTKVWFTYKNSTKGERNPYEFAYQNNGVSYDRLQQDRWGYYNPVFFGSDDYATDFPYQRQFDHSNPAGGSTFNDIRGTIDANKSEWSLNQIKTPTGSTISIAYESDDYGYVQDRQATQMFKIVNTGFAKYKKGNSASYGTDVERKLYGEDYEGGNAKHRRVYFALEKPIPTNLTPSEKKQAIDQYFNGLYNGSDAGTKQLYYKILVDIRSPQEGENGYRELVSGYSDVKNWGLSDEEFEGNHVIGWVEIEKTKIGDKTLHDFHPFSVAAWQYLRTNLPMLENLPGDLDKTAGTDNASKAGKAKSLITMITDIGNLFVDYYARCDRNHFGSNIYCNNSVIRLCSPDKKKIGGGLRTKSVTVVNDKIEVDGEDATYGYVYEYVNEDGSSSGVATYEPIVGGDEIALRRSATFKQSIKLKSDNNLYFEYPINESYYPGASVGYSRVVVKSYALKRKLSSNLGLSAYNNKYGTKGITISEFYTAKDFPVITDYTLLRSGIEKNKMNIQVPLLFMGMVSETFMSAYQGYQVEVNNMHGQPETSANYGVDDTGKLIKEPISWVKYNYHSEPYYHEGQQVNKLVNIVPTLVADGVIENREMGVDYEMFVDARSNYSKSQNLGFNPNGDGMPFFGITIPSWLPNVGRNVTDLKTIVTNKIITRTGIVKSVEAFNGQSKVVTDNKYFDALTGQPLLTTVNNNYDHVVYNYSMPGHWYYPGMGPAYLNVGFSITNAISSSIPISNNKLQLNSTNLASSNFKEDFWEFSVGDLVMLTQASSGGGSEAKFLGYITSKDLEASPPYLNISTLKYTTGYTNGSLATGKDLIVKVLKSGRKNHLSAIVGGIQSLKNPIFNRDKSSFCYIDPIHTNATTEDVDVFDDCVVETFDLLNFIIDNGKYDQLLAGGIDLDNSPYNLFGPCPGFSGNVEVTTNCTSTTVLGVTTSNETVTNGITVESPTGIDNPPYEDGQDDIEVPKTTYSTDSRSICEDTRIVFGTCTLEVYKQSDGLYMPLSKVEEFVPNPTPVASSFTAPFSLIGIVGTIDVLEKGNSIYTPCYISIIGSGCSLPIHQETRVVDEFSECTVVRYEKVDQVINASATKYSDSWPVDRSTSNGETYSSLAFANGFPYQFGGMGIWRPSESYVYVEDRNQIDPTYGPVLHIDGTYDGFPIFAWDNPFYFDPECNEGSKWIKSSTITKYNAFNYEIENRNPLDIYSTALYGYDGKLETAVSANARYYEIGFEGFEEQSNTTTGFMDNTTGNLDFVNTYTGSFEKVVDVFEISKSIGNSASIVTSVGHDLTGYSGSGYSYLVVGEAPPVLGLTPPIPYETRMEVFSATGFSSSSCSLGFQNNDSRCWKGKLYVIKERTVSGATVSIGDAIATNEDAHTGNQSFKVITSGVKYFPQYLLDLESNKKYVISAWVKKDLPNSYTYSHATPGRGVEIKLKFNSSVSLAIGKPIGELINGWQKIEFEFVTPSSTENFEIGLQASGLGDQNLAAYFDDIRLFPADASMVTYVYDVSDFRMMGILDDNNYAVFYSYDEQGGLNLVKKETPNGVLTVETSINHIKPTFTP